eukprot:COSAG05_NODE_357_length_10830_cov_5.181810_2_plen_113_part_00
MPNTAHYISMALVRGNVSLLWSMARRRSTAPHRRASTGPDPAIAESDDELEDDDMVRTRSAPPRVRPLAGVRLDHAGLANRARRWMPDDRARRRTAEISDALAAAANAVAPR